jgi:hypothetical protein
MLPSFINGRIKRLGAYSFSSHPSFNLFILVLKPTRCTKLSTIRVTRARFGCSIYNMFRKIKAAVVVFPIK